MNKALLLLCAGSLLLLAMSLMLSVWLPWLGRRYVRLGLRAFLGATALLSLFLLGSSADSHTRKVILGPFARLEKRLQTVRKPVDPGLETRLAGDASDMVGVAIDAPAYQELRGAVAAQDVDAIDLLIASARVLPVRGGTKVRVLDSSGFLEARAEVRILEGPYADRVGWMAAGAVKGGGASGRGFDGEGAADERPAEAAAAVGQVTSGVAVACGQFREDRRWSRGGGNGSNTRTRRAGW